MKLNEFFAQALKQNGADTVFGIPSYVGMRILDGLDKAGFDIVLNSHEQNAAHAAEGYFLATGKLPVLSVAIGPGVTNAITGVTNAFVDSIPMIIVAARASDTFYGKNEYHSHSGIGRNLNEKQLIESCTKQAYYLDNVTHAPQLIRDAIRTALTGRPGPVFISIPPGLQEADIDSKILPSRIALSSSPRPSLHDLTACQTLYQNSKKPLFIFGSELRQSQARLKKLLTKNAPYMTSYGAKGRVPILPNYMGTLWYDNSQHLVQVIEQSDLIILVGEHLTHFTARPILQTLKEKLVIQVTQYEEELGRALAITTGVVADSNQFLLELGAPKKPWKPKVARLTEPKTYSALKVIRHLGKLAPKNAVFFSDVGSAAYATITDLDLQEGQEFYTSGKFGSCGYSIPTAVGFAYANKKRPVISIVGDLSFLMNLQEVANVSKFGTNNSFIVFTNGIPQNITVDQELELGKSIQAEFPKVSFKAVAEAFGVSYRKVNSMDSFERALTNPLKSSIIEVIVERDDSPLS